VADRPCPLLRGPDRERDLLPLERELAGGLYCESSVPPAELKGTLARGDGKLPKGEFETGWIVLADGSFRGRKNVGGKLTSAGSPGGSEVGTGFIDPTAYL
jgi:hypothetical protein